MLADEINDAQRLVRTDAYQMSIGEIVSMYDDCEIIVDPEFQRLFRWEIGQKSKLIESLLLGIPLPSIFVFEKEDGKWELIDGLQRVSTVLEFMGKLRGPSGDLQRPSILEGTKYLPSLSNAVWERSELIPDVSPADQLEIDKAFKLAIRRARIGVEILKRPSDDQTKFDLFQRLNAGGTLANPQELRNCIMLMSNGEYFRAIKAVAGRKSFRDLFALTKRQIKQQRPMELAARFLVHALIPYTGKLDVGEYINNGIITLARLGNSNKDSSLIKATFKLLGAAGDTTILRRIENGRPAGKVGLVGLECIAVGVAKNIRAIHALPDPTSFVKARVSEFWSRPEVATFIQPGLRGTTRIQRTVPFGASWFRP